jgi:DNA (cytosine-5)-methyltransferase 1
MAAVATDPFALPTARGQPLELSPRVPGRGDCEDDDRRWLGDTSRPWAVDLFCGAGGLSLGLERAGFTVIAAADVDERAVQTHAANFDGMAWHLDLSHPGEFIDRLARRGVNSVDLVAGGPPCQPFSRAGAAKLRSLVAVGVRSPDDGRVTLWQTFLTVIDALGPSSVLVENVPDLARWADGEIVRELIGALRARGFEPEARVLNAWEHGVPQHRARLFLLATKRGGIRWPPRQAKVTLRDAIGDLPVVPPAQRESKIDYTGTPSVPFQRRARQGLRGDARQSVLDHCTRDVRSDDAEAFSLLGEGQTYADLPARLKRYRSDIFDDKYKRLTWEEVSRTITAHIAKDGYWYIHPAQDRTLSIREAARVQTFPDTFRFAGHPTTQLRQIGNAVPPALAEAVGRQLMNPETNTPLASPHTAFSGWTTPDELVDPWLRSKDPWATLLGELLLRQCARGRAEHALNEVLSAAPTASCALLHGDEGPPGRHFLTTNRWQRLLTVARTIHTRFDDRVPSSDNDLLGIPGVGAAVAAAVRCFAWDQPAVVLDAGTRRVVSRVTGLESSSAWVNRLEIYRWAGQDGPDRAFNLALRAVAAEHCRPTNPVCSSCPLMGSCTFAAEQRQVGIISRDLVGDGGRTLRL